MPTENFHILLCLPYLYDFISIYDFKKKYCNSVNKIYKAVATLTVFSLIERVLGFGFKIYLSRELGASALGVYQVALSFFFVLLSVTISGLPLVTGKLTAAYDVTGKKKMSDSLVSAGLIINIIISVLLAVLVLIFQGILDNILASQESVLILIIFLPAILFGAAGAAFRGSLWGRERYFAVSVIELIEQIARILICIVLFLIGINKLQAAAYSLVIAMLLNSALCAICYFRLGGRLANAKGQIKPLLSASIPISGMRAASSLVNSVMAVAVPFLFISAGLSKDASLAAYGACLGMAFPLLYIPVTVVGALAYTLIPSLSKAMAKGDKKEIKRQVESAINFSVIAAAVFVPAFYSIGKPLGVFVFGIEEAGQFMKLGGILLIPISLESIISSMMNSLGLEKRGFVNYMIGNAVSFGIMFCFFGNFSIDVLFWAIMAALVISTVLDIIAVKKKTGISLKFIRTIFMCALLAFPAISLTEWTFALISAAPEWLSLSLCAMLSAVAFVLLAFVFGLIDFSIILRYGKKRTAGKLKSLPKPKQNSIIRT